MISADFATITYQEFRTIHQTNVAYYS